MDQIQLSATKLAKLAHADFCAFCFWVYLMIHQRPPFDQFPGIFSSIDRFTKGGVHAHFDKHNKPPKCFQSFTHAVSYLEVGRLKYLEKKHGILLTGEPDDVFELEDGSLELYDYKTARFPKALENDDDESGQLLSGYRVQLNVYDHLLSKNGYGACDKAALVYFDPMTHLSEDEHLKQWDDNGMSLRFEAKILPIELNAAELLPPLIEKVREIYESAKPPKGRDGCKNCERIKALFEVSGKSLTFKDTVDFVDWVWLGLEFGDPKTAISDAFRHMIHN